MRLCRSASWTARQTARQTAICLAVAVLAWAPAAAAQRLYARPSPDTYAHSQRPLPAEDGTGPDAGHTKGTHPFDTAFRSLVADTLAAWHVPGVSIAVLDGDDTWTEGFGLASLQTKTPMTADTLFYTASTTKAFLAAALSLIIDSGNYSVSDGIAQPLDWTTPIANVLPDDFVLTDDAPWETAHVTLEDALSHRTGLASHDLARSRRYGLDPESLGRNATVRDVTRSLRHLPAPLHTSPRTEWRYSNLMFLVLSHAVESLTGGRWLGDTFRQWIWAPLGMTATFLDLDDARAAAADTQRPEVLAEGYYWDAEGGGGFVPVPHMPLEEVSGAGGIISTVHDYAKWLRCWIDGPAFSANNNASSRACGGIPFSQAGLDAILTPKMFTSKTSASPKPFDAPMAYASAWTTCSYKGHRFYGHSGGSNAFGAQVYFFPEDRFGVVAFGNTAVTSNKVELILLWHLVDERFGIPKEQRHDWDKLFWEASAARRARVDTALERLYADRARPPLQPALPLAAYTGTFHHPTYQNMTVRLAGKASRYKDNKYKDYEVTFTAERLLHTWPTLCEFVHVSGEHWFVYTDMVYEKSGNFRSYARAWFEVGADGRADRLMVEFWSADDDTVEGVIPFDRVQD